jgi:hypothetical protein
MSDAGTGIRHGLQGPDGFVTGLHLTPAEVQGIKALIEAQWRRRLRQLVPTLAGAFERLGIERYHQLAHRVDHAALWPKRSRILGPQAVEEIRSTSLAARLQRELGNFAISDEEQIGWPEVYWRIVRPGCASDVGPLHADAWFWELGHGVTPPGCTRVKVWVAVVAEPGRSGLLLVPGSHHRHWRYHAEHRDGMLKPRLEEETPDPQLIAAGPGDAVVFHDRLLHGGAVSRGTLTRISFEFTLLVRQPAAGGHVASMQ